MTHLATPPSSHTPIAVEVWLARPDDLDAIIAMMARAFDDEPYYRWLYGDDDRYQERLLRFLRQGIPHWRSAASTLCTTESLLGAVDWARHESSPPPFPQWFLSPLIDAAMERTPWKLSRRRARAAHLFARLHPRLPHYHLFGLTVEPEYQGRSIGSQLLRPGLERCDREGTPAYLETGKERAAAFYERHGFEVANEAFLPGGGPKVYFMWREPR